MISTSSENENNMQLRPDQLNFLFYKHLGQKHNFGEVKRKNKIHNMLVSSIFDTYISL